MREEEKDKFYKFGERYYFDWNGIPDVLEGFISSLLSQKEKEVREEIEKKEDKDVKRIKASVRRVNMSEEEAMKLIDKVRNELPMNKPNKKREGEDED